MQNYEVIVIGVGSMGSAACAYLAKRGIQVLGIDQFSPPHTEGSHSGVTRIIRQAYYEHPDYVPLLKRAYELWAALENPYDKIYHQTGILYMGRKDSSVLKGTRLASTLYEIPVESINKHAYQGKKYPFILPQDWEIIWEDQAGFLIADQAIAMLTDMATQYGAKIHTEEKIISWQPSGHGYVVKTSKNNYTASKLVFTAGSWTQNLLKEYSPALSVRRQVLAWAEPDDPKKFYYPNFPSWFLHDPEKGMYYGFPYWQPRYSGDIQGLKIGLHMPGIHTDPDIVDRNIHDFDKTDIEYFIENYLPNSKLVIKSYKTCLYTYTPDENFIIDFIPESNNNIMVACGFSGHGFKFVPVIGEILADMAILGSSKHAIDFLKLNRFIK